LSGNEAIVEGVLKAGLGFFSAYPITPATEIMESIAKTDVKFIQGEDEIAAINMCIGASLAGSKAMTATSGPGFSLKQESIGYAYKIGVPLVVVCCQRVGPSTGMATFGAQSDVMQARYGSHGDYVNIVFSPNSVEECYKLAIESINAAEESHSPVIYLVDGILAHMSETVDLDGVNFEIKKRKLEPLGTGKRHFTGLTSQGNTPKEKDPMIYREWYYSRKKEILNAAKNYQFFEYLENKDSDTLLIAFGISSRVILPLKEKYSIFRPIRLFPVVEQIEEIAKKYSKIVVIEMNDGQYRHELQAFLKREVKLISQLGGKISLGEIENELSGIN